MQIEKLVTESQEETESLINRIISDNKDTQILVSNKLIKKVHNLGRKIKYRKDTKGYFRVACAVGYNCKNSGMNQLVVINKKGDY